MEEMIDVLDETTGNYTGKIVSKKEAHRIGIWHGAIHIIVINTDKTKTLLQKRCELKQLYPNMWDIAVGGHISSGEDALISAKRELKEELGLDLDNYKIKLADKIKEQLNNNGVISNEFVYVYIVYADIDISQIKLQDEEVSEVKWCTINELNTLINNKQVVPHSKEYEILNDILK